MQNFEIKKRTPNIIGGLIFGIFAINLSPNRWSYVSYVISVLLFIYGDQIIKRFYLSADSGKYKLKGNAVELIIKDKNGNIKEKDK
jgi:hypothetical protein